MSHAGRLAVSLTAALHGCSLLDDISPSPSVECISPSKVASCVDLTKNAVAVVVGLAHVGSEPRINFRAGGDKQTFLPTCNVPYNVIIQAQFPTLAKLSGGWDVDVLPGKKCRPQTFKFEARDGNTKTDMGSAVVAFPCDSPGAPEIQKPGCYNEAVGDMALLDGQSSD